MIDFTAQYTIVDSQRTNAADRLFTYRLEQKDSLYCATPKEILRHGGAFGIYAMALFHKLHPAHDRPSLRDEDFPLDLINGVMYLLSCEKVVGLSTDLSIGFVQLDSVLRSHWLHPIIKELDTAITERENTMSALQALRDKHARLGREKDAFIESMNSRLSEQAQEINALRSTPVNTSCPACRLSSKPETAELKIVRSISRLPVPRLQWTGTKPGGLRKKS